MHRERPTVVLVMGILNMVFGGVFLLCLGVGAVGLLRLQQQAASDPNLTEYFRRLDKELPGYQTILIGTNVVQLVLMSILVVAGIGLVCMQSWGRWISVFWGALIIVMRLCDLIYSFGYVHPAVTKVLREQGGGGDPSAALAGTMVGAVLGAVLLSAYAIALMITLFSRSVSAAFAGKDSSLGDYTHDDLDYDRPREPNDHIRPDRDQWNR